MIQKYPTLVQIYKILKMDPKSDEANIVPEVYNILMWTCNRCGYCWPKTPGKVPRTCASKECNSPYWNKPRVR